MADSSLRFVGRWVWHGSATQVTGVSVQGLLEIWGTPSVNSRHETEQGDLGQTIVHVFVTR